MLTLFADFNSLDHVKIPNYLSLSVHHYSIHPTLKRSNLLEIVHYSMSHDVPQCRDGIEFTFLHHASFLRIGDVVWQYTRWQTSQADTTEFT